VVRGLCEYSATCYEKHFIICFKKTYMSALLLSINQLARNFLSYLSYICFHILTSLVPDNFGANWCQMFITFSSCNHYTSTVWLLLWFTELSSSIHTLMPWCCRYQLKSLLLISSGNVELPMILIRHNFIFSIWLVLLCASLVQLYTSMLVSFSFLS
jgi:hypothetical protein